MFKTFPEFSKPTLKDREEYEAFVKDFPPVSDLSFVSLMTIWNSLDAARIAILNDNLVISYWMPGEERLSGLSLIGTNRIDESICVLFDHLKSQGREARLVNIPQFVVDHIRYPEIFHFDIKHDDEDFIISLKHHSSLSELPFYRRARIKKFVRNSGNLEMKSLDLEQSQNQKLLIDSAAQWPHKGLNAIGKFEEEAFQYTVRRTRELGVDNVCLFDDGELILFNLYYVFPQSNYLLVANGRLDYSIPYIFDYMTYGFPEWWLGKGIEFANIHSDMGIRNVRLVQALLRPVEILRKYTIKPAS